MSTEHAEMVILACCVLHNFLRTKLSTDSHHQTCLADTIEPNGNIVDGQWRDDETNHLNRINRTNNRHATQQAIDIRNNLVRYFSGAGQLAWQDGHVDRI